LAWVAKLQRGTITLLSLASLVFKKDIASLILGIFFFGLHTTEIKKKKKDSKKLV
jgi:hypothetical protein